MIDSEPNLFMPRDLDISVTWTSGTSDNDFVIQ